MKRFTRTDSTRSLRFRHIVAKRTMVVVCAALDALRECLPTGPMIGSPRLMADRPIAMPAMAVSRPREGRQR